MKADVATSPHRADTVAANQVSVERAIRRMKEHLAEPLDLDALAQAAAISKFHLVRVFDETTGTTPHHFLSCLRIQRAKELLLESGLAVTDVCLEVGYNSPGTFSKTFSELVGLSPQEFRAMPKRLTARQFAKAIGHYLAAKRTISGPTIEGVVEGPGRPKGFVFVGTFTSGVPLGVPLSGTVLIRDGKFCIERPRLPEFHLLAALLPLSASLADMAASLPLSLVASLRVANDPAAPLEKPVLRLRPLRPTDPPIVLALPALPPLRG
ncbi:MAG TPA: AraC family transcriptional regulator [Candidatus Acidoferrales bacterium]|nr:AraC family transcriptional regulator [Candidatus Acidoferrales bacterium]